MAEATSEQKKARNVESERARELEREGQHSTTQVSLNALCKHMGVYAAITVRAKIR